MRALIIAVLLLPSVAFAGQGMYPIPTVYTASSGGSCMSGTYILGWGGEWPSDTDKACATSGDSTGVDGTSSGVLLGTSYGEGDPDIGMHVDAANDHISYTQTADQYINDTGEVTIWMRIYVSANPTGNTYIFTAYKSVSEYIIIALDSTLGLYGTYRGSGLISQVYAPGSFTADTWVDVAYSFSKTTNVHSAYVGSWRADETDNLATSTIGDISEIEIGEGNNLSGWNMPASEFIQVTKWAIVSGYKAAKPW